MIIMIVFLIKLIFISKIEMNQSINVLLKNVKTVVLNDSKIQRLLLNIQIIMRDVPKNIEQYNPGKKCNLFTVFQDVVADIISNKKINQIVTQLLTGGRKQNISVFIAQSYFPVPEDVRLNSTHFFIMKIPSN